MMVCFSKLGINFNGFTVIGTQIILPAGSKSSLTYTYTLPRSYLNNNEYRLRLVRQSGSEAFYSLTVETPPGTQISSPDFQGRENRARLSTFLRQDRDVVLQILPDTIPPYPIEQVFENLNI